MEMDVRREEYVDVNDALNRIGGNMDLYKRLIGRFRDGNHYDMLCEAISGGDAEESARLAHTLKGVSANLSLVKIREITTDIEQSIKEGADYNAQLSELGSAYNKTMEIVAEILGQ